MTVLPPSFFQDGDAFRDDDVTEILDEQELEGHEHGEDCGHEAVQHGDHIDYVTDTHHHFLKDGIWHRHKKPDA